MRKTVSVLALSAALAAGCAHCPLCGGEWGAAEKARLAAEEAAKVPLPRTAAGSVACIDRVTVLPTYRVRVRLANLRTGETAASAESDSFSGFPWFFTLEYDAKDLRKGDPYGLAAELLAGEEVLYRTDTQYAFPAEDGVSGVDLVVSRVRN
jgi:uncharacterized lipoprotein YbaY